MQVAPLTTNEWCIERKRISGAQFIDRCIQMGAAKEPSIRIQPNLQMSPIEPRLQHPDGPTAWGRVHLRHHDKRKVPVQKLRYRQRYRTRIAQ